MNIPPVNSSKRDSLLRWVTAVYLFAMATVHSADAPISRLDRTSPLQYRTSAGEISTAKTKEEWLLRRREIIEGAEQIMGRFPTVEKRCPLEMRVEEEADCGSYVRRRITYVSEPGSRVPAYLCLPKSALEKNARVSAVLCLHPTDIPLGPKVVVGLGGRRIDNTRRNWRREDL